MRVNSAADDAAGLAIMESMEAQIRGLDQGTENSRDMQNMIMTAEGSLEGVGDNLQRIRELSLQAANDTLNPSQRQLIQEEIGQLTNEIQSTVGRAEFNGQRLLDGNMGPANTASGPDGTGMQVTLPDMASLTQEITGYSVEVDNGIEVDWSDVDAAMSVVNSARADMGAQANRLDSTISSNPISSLNLADSRSRIADADMAAEMMSVNQERIINQMQIMMQVQAQNQEEDNARLVSAV